MRFRPVLSAVVGAVLMVGMVPALGAAAADGVAEPAMSEAERALRQAKDTGKPVEIVGARSESTTTYANTDGESFQLDQSVVPVRVKTDEGGWVAPDATLEVRADGTVGPKAATVDVSFSNGGAGAGLVKLEDGNRSLSLGWPGTLPKPTLDGPNATYQEVLPGVDLRMTSTLEGYREVLVVKTPQAAANPALKRLEYAMDSEGLTVTGSKDGGFTASDGDGNEVFAAPPALMWDSTGDSGSGAPVSTVAARSESSQVKTAAFTSRSGTAAAVEPAAAAATSEAPSSAGAPAAPDSGAEEAAIEGPDNDDVKAVVPIEVDHDSVTMIPNAGMLAKTDPSAYPIYIDPDVESNEVERLMVNNNGVSIHDWGNGEDDEGKGVGNCGTWHGVSCGSGYKQRLYFKFTPTKLQGKIVLDATFRITENWAFQCDPRNVWLVRTKEFTQSTTWGSRPAYMDLLGDRWVSAGRGSLCESKSPDEQIEFNDNPDEPEENLTPTVRDFADGKFDRLTLELRAENEEDPSAWKRFRNDAVLSVKYVGRPGMPTDVAVNEGGSDGDCAKDARAPMVISETKPSLKARAQTAPGGGSETNLRVVMFVEKQNSDGSWSTVGETLYRDWPHAPAYATDGQLVAGDSHLTLVDGPLYRYRAWVRTYNGSSQVWGGPATPGCYFKVDTLAPKPPVVGFVSTYTDCEKDCTAHGGPGRGGDFTFKPAAGDVNTAYRYRLNTDADGEWSASVKGATAEVRVVPNTSGLISLSVQAYDGFAWGAQKTVKFNVARRGAPVSHWNFNETSGVAQDTNPHTTNPAEAKTEADAEDAATLYSGASRPSDGRRGWVPEFDFEDRALKLDGISGYAATKERVISTQSSYTISAWVRPDRVDKTFSVLGQAGDFMSGVSISHHADSTWAVRLPTSDDAGANISTYVVESKRPAVAGVWTQITATYSAYSDMLRLYINGEKQGEVEVENPVWADGPMSFGRIKYRGDWVNYFPGLIDEVTVWQDLLTPEEIRDNAKLHDAETNATFAELVANWNPEGPTGSSLSDTSGYNRDLALSSGAVLSGEYLTLNGSSGAGTVPAPPLDDTGSFTATARVDIDGQKLAARADGSKVHVLGQRTASGSAWGIWFEKTSEGLAEKEGELVPEAKGIWHFGRLDGSSSVSVESDEVVHTEAVQVTGVYDAQEGTISLYLGARSNGGTRNFTAAVGSGQFAVGKGYAGGQWGDYLPGTVREVRLWAGAFSADQINERVLG